MSLKNEVAGTAGSLLLLSAAMQYFTLHLISRTTWISAETKIDLKSYDHIDAITFKFFLPLLPPKKVNNKDNCSVCQETSKDAFVVCKEEKHLLHAKCIHDWIVTKGEDLLNSATSNTISISKITQGDSINYKVNILKKKLATCTLCKQDLNTLKISGIIHFNSKENRNCEVIPVDEIE